MTYRILFLMFFALIPCSGQELPREPISADSIVAAIPFRLDEAYTHYWRAEKPRVDRGMVLILQVNPDLLRPRQTAEPVLYVGNQTAERINIGHKSGYLLVLAPSLTEAQLAQSAIWFGSANLPERIDRAEITQQAAWAAGNAIGPFDADTLARAREEGGQLRHVKNKNDLLASLVPLLQQYAPDEEDLIRGFKQSKR